MSVISVWLFSNIHSICTISACLGSFSFGTAMSWTSPALPYIADCQLGDKCDFNYRYFYYNLTKLGFLIQK